MPITARITAVFHHLQYEFVDVVYIQLQPFIPPCQLCQVKSGCHLILFVEVTARFRSRPIVIDRIGKELTKITASRGFLIELLKVAPLMFLLLIAEMPSPHIVKLSCIWVWFR